MSSHWIGYYFNESGQGSNLEALINRFFYLIGDGVTARTLGAEIIETYSSAVEDLERLKFGPYSPSAISGIIVPLGAKTELYLKSTIFPAANSNKNFNNLVNDLKSEGVADQDVDSLHDFRRLYNAAKHDPQADHGLATTLDIIIKAKKAVREVDVLGLGLTNTPLVKTIKYHLWVGFWDSYLGGFTEAAIMLPGDNWRKVSATDTIYLDFHAWDELKVTLHEHPRFRFGETEFPRDVWQSFTDDGDFLNAGVWDGDYAELIRLLTLYANRSIESKLLPGLARTDSYISIGTSLISSCLAIIHEATSTIPSSILEERLLTKAESDYALQPTERVRESAAQVCKLIKDIPHSEWRALSGPFLALRRQLSVSGQHTASGPLHLILENNTIVLVYSDEVKISILKLDGSEEK